ncbi:Ig-like domain-containing protein [Pseudoalteromonas byunsanensis]|uniref:Dystroglycan-type cadherin-like domain-containing protein n=1 Tax=Pseudoalteromonas byunsanensis TaxID=327939 RepID=A0A1S1N0E2_9GAMM|nr:Ig-like domain-containing protein [Pseudoalteromonas byunsanensis]OHU93469.1 hypothetical protein BIW53_19120 [Pseudoalteromonas byunsanensis]
MDTNQKEWLTRSFFLNNHINKLRLRQAFTVPIGITMLVSSQVNALECDFVSADQTHINASSFLSTLYCANGFAHVGHILSATYTSEGRLLEYANIDEEMPSQLAIGELYTFTNSNSTTQPKQSVTARWTEEGWKEQFLQTEPAELTQIYLSSESIQRNIYSSLIIQSDAYAHDYQLIEGEHDNALFAVDYNSLRLKDPYSTDIGSYTISIEARAGYSPETSLTQTFTIEVTDSPILHGFPKTEVYQGENYYFSPLSTELYHGYSYFIKNKPDWIRFDISTGSLSGVPTTDDIGTTEPITIAVTDGIQAFELKPFSITVKDYDYIPKIGHYSWGHYLNFYSGIPLRIYPELIENKDSDPLTYSLLNAPQWLSIDEKTGIVSGTPPQTFSGNVESMMVAVTDGHYTSHSLINSLYVQPLELEQLELTQKADIVYDLTPSQYINEEEGLRNYFDLDPELQYGLFKLINTSLAPNEGSIHLGSSGAFNVTLHNTAAISSVTFDFVIEVNGKNSKIFTATANINEGSDEWIQTDEINSFEDNEVIIDVLDNDKISDLTRAQNTLQITTKPYNGQAIVDNGVIRYTPDPNTFGRDTFQYSFMDAYGVLHPSSYVYINVQFVNDLPTFDSDSIGVLEDGQSQTITLRNLTSDVEETVPSGAITLINPPNKGTFSFNLQDESVTYQPYPNATGEDFLQFTVTDSMGGVSAPGKITFNIEPVNDIPVAENDHIVMLEDSIAQLDVLQNDTDIEDERFLAANITLEDKGQGVGEYELAQVVVSEEGLLEITPKANLSGQFSFSYTVADSDGAVSEPAQVNITITALNDAPVASALNISGHEDGSITTSLSATDVDSHSLTYHLFEQPTHGTLSLEGNVATYVPNAHYNGQDSFTFTVSDGALTSLPATVSISIAAIEDAPTIAGSPQTSVNQDQDYLFIPSSHDNDLDVLTFVIDNKPSWADFNTTTGALFGTPTNDDVGGYENIIIKVSDGTQQVQLAPFSIMVENINDLPQLSGVPSNSIEEDSEYVFTPVLIDPDQGDTHTFTITNKPTWASFDTQTGTLSGTPLDEHVGITESIVISVKDSAKNSQNVSLEAFDLEVTNSNDAPIAYGFAFSLNEGDMLSVTPAQGLLSTAHDDDIDSGDTLHVELINTALSGELTLSQDGAFNYAHNGSETHQDVFTYVVKDNSGAVSAIQTVNLTITAVEDAPVANNDSASTDEDTPTTFSLIENDVDAEQNLVPASTHIITPPENGSVTIENGVVVYTPNTNFHGMDSFTYKVKDATQLSSELATASVTVNSVNDAPVASNINVEVNEDTSSEIINIRQLTTDDDDTYPNGQIELITQPSLGSVSLDQEKGTFVYTPAANLVGTDTFSYTISDSEGLASNEATIAVNIGAINDRPIVENDTVTTDEDTSVTLNILANDSDVEDTGFNGANITLEDQGQGPGIFELATVSVNPEGTLTIEPLQDKFGELNFTYTLTDSEGLTSAAANVTATITSVNDAPVAIDNEAIVEEDGFFEINVLGNDIDVDIDAEQSNDYLDTSSTTVVTEPLNGTAQVTQSGHIVYSPNANFNGEDSFTYTVQDSYGMVSNQATVRVTVSAINDAPQAHSNDITLNEDSNVEITLSGTDEEQSALTFDITRQPSNGVLTQLSEAVWSYAPNPDYHGEDSFSFTANDGQLSSAPALVNISVQPINDAPHATNMSVQTSEENTLTISLEGSDVDNQTLSYSIVAEPANGSVSLQGNIVSYIPNTDFVGKDTFMYVSNDGQLNSSAANVEIDVTNVNDAPQITGVPATNIGRGSVYSFTPTVTDIDSGSFTFGITNKPDWAMFDTLTGTLAGTPTRNDVGITRNIEISVSDSEHTSSLAPFDIEVTFANTPPRSESQSIFVAEDGTTSFIPQIFDVDGDALSVVIIQQPTSGSVSVQGNTISYTPNADFNGKDAFSYQADDGADKSSESSILVTVEPVNDMPQANDDDFEFTAIESNRYSLDVLANDNDVDQQPLTLVGAQASIGTVTISNSQLVYQAANSSATTATIDYVIADSEQARSTATAIVKITSTQAGLPQITAPSDINIDAQGLFTKADLGVAAATDLNGNDLPVSLVNSKRVFKPGKHLVYWQTEDAQGRQATAVQQVLVQPIVSIVPGQTISEGNHYTLEISLNGDAPIYPVTVPYVISGTANELDHSLNSGEVEITQGRSATLSFDVYQDAQPEEDETLIVTLGADINTESSSQSAVFTIAQGNIAPELTLKVSQQAQNRTLIAKDQGNVSIKALFSDINQGDVLTINWQSSALEIENTSTSADLFEFSPALLNEGVYTITATVSDNGEPALNSSKTVHIEVIEQFAPLGNQDSDGDMIPDNEEGYSDSDGDGIADYLDAIDQPNVLQSQAGSIDGFLIEAQHGISLRKGVTVSQNISGGARLLSSELPEDDNAQNVGGLYDFIASGLAKAGDIFTVVLPQYEPIPANAIYRKYKHGQWHNFNTEQGDSVMSAPGEQGYCPAPGSILWQPGLTAGHWCIKLNIADGGANDDDGIANKQVVDPSGMAVVLDGNHPPVATPDEIKVKAGKRTRLNLLDNDSDPDNDAITLYSVQSELGEIDSHDDVIYLTTPDNYIGDISVNYMIVDTKGASANGVATVTTYINSAPLAHADVATTTLNSTIDIDVLANDTDQDGDDLTIIKSSADKGKVSVTDTGMIRFTPEVDFSGVATVSYTIADGEGAVASAEVKVTVTNDSKETSKTDSSVTQRKSSGSFGVLLMFILCSVTAMRRVSR